MKPVIAVDLDEVLAKYIAEFFSYHNLLYGTSVVEDDMYCYDLGKVLGIPRDEHVKRIRDFESSEYFPLIRPVAGAAEGVRELANSRKLAIVTARPEEIREGTSSWLNKHYPSVFDTIRFANHWASAQERRPKSELCREIGAELLIEDSMENASEVAAAGIPVLLYERPWNRNDALPKGVTRVKSWEEILRHLS